MPSQLSCLCRRQASKIDDRDTYTSTPELRCIQTLFTDMDSHELNYFRNHLLFKNHCCGATGHAILNP